MPLLLLALAGLAAAAPPPPADFGVILDKMEGLEEEFNGLCGRAEPDLAQLKAIRGSYLGDPRPDLLERRASEII